ncbi:hypothetical protein L228DRAFT_40257 [Xylona heveae TC161]|uniref:DASH complex subunit DUO1 n=1 Tax=Xylona heveae (strain CBS 132557 / TC161) TaxID=1328760 RepID=A0A164ZZY9_XYLHT|nr:hypothetical protein L228DRAFT_40257 [Xylona heveae TC161]KZF19756.1 hypothetical protein L228DRAFT_40257 [Xylona heveae TC161]
MESHDDFEIDLDLDLDLEATPKMADLDLSDRDHEELLASPSKPDTQARGTNTTTIPLSDKESTIRQRSRQAEREPRFDTEEEHEASLRSELQSVRNINHVIEGVVDSLERAKGNMETVARTVTSASALLNTWVRILSQTEHNQRLILNPSWHGATQDVADMEKEAILKRQAAERKEQEERQKREAAIRAAEEAERRKAETASRGATRGTRSRGRVLGRGASMRPSAVPAPTRVPSRTNTTAASRAGSNIGRGIGSTRGRVRSVR